jgi:hypothetical protein
MALSFQRKLESRFYLTPLIPLPSPKRLPAARGFGRQASPDEVSQERGKWLGKRGYAPLELPFNNQALPPA